ncbi:MAG: Asp-tRNA(Asn)/Glu-tRNA(Gln) amidotransferase subunit GatC [Canidatus Methanoxibalbensis ujae]|nr:Asp-tRNA(Asn)/Glu-tRNA(Gln) amidotransferase subunit GatC [Candidatus Methanoxibalbensis ujae]MCW7077530.1 Asp-tRNA(Asn)/Glu-tRNA(Gln) amidotransferase subunit GatC [Candidatus Methanoxibalbensis ujae]
MRQKMRKEDIEHLCWLARIELSDEEKEKFAAQLSEILEYFSILDEADTSDVEPTFHAVGVENVMREDVPEESLDQEDALMNAPRKEKGYFRGPRIL